MGQRTTSTVLLLVAILAVPSACGGPAQSVAPTPFPAGTANPSPGSTANTSPAWNVTIETTALTGPAFCIYTPSVGMVFRGPYDVVRRSDTVSFIPPDPLDWDSFTGSLAGSDFVAINAPVGSGTGMCTHYVQASDLTGRFSADGNSFSAIEHWSFTLDSGEVKTVTFSWSGTRR